MATLAHMSFYPAAVPQYSSEGMSNKFKTSLSGKFLGSVSLLLLKLSDIADFRYGFCWR